MLLKSGPPDSELKNLLLGCLKSEIWSWADFEAPPPLQGVVYACAGEDVLFFFGWFSLWILINLF